MTTDKPDIHAADGVSDELEFSQRDLYVALLRNAGLLEQQVRFTDGGRRRGAFSKAEMRRELLRFAGMQQIIGDVVRAKYPGMKTPSVVVAEYSDVVAEGERRAARP
ncbi:hypothetical protein [Mycolicibacterium sphagni]|uniref:hypothetical protein n=1 Tax=Mycolicibacterium sphagni TaxID=1786 RepID=UPI0021F25F2F|nr:hypothetical protein [Mycolicibacterium sphagni]MCV7174822.1 hypothetical protein [Mycolicibacterium sphagni]